MARQGNIDVLIPKAAREAGVPEGLFRRLIKRGERSYKGWQSSPAGAFGPSQLMPGTAEGLRRQYGIDPNDYYGNLLGGAYYLRDMLKTFKGDQRKAVAAYNAGPGNVQKYGGVPPFAETQRYVQNIFGGWNPSRQTSVSGPRPPRAPSAPAAAAGLPPMPDFLGKSLASVARGGSAVAAFTRMMNEQSGWEEAMASRPRAAPAPAGPSASSPAPTSEPMTKIGSFVKPLGSKLPGSSAFSYVDAEGAPDASGTRHHAGLDWFAPAGAVVRSPVGGEVVEVKASRGRSGQVFGGTVKVQDANGRVFVFRHVDPLRVRVGQRVRPGANLARVTAWTDGSPHSHVEVWKSLAGGYNYENMIDPWTIFGGNQ